LEGSESDLGDGKEGEFEMILKSKWSLGLKSLKGVKCMQWSRNWLDTWMGDQIESFGMGWRHIAYTPDI